MLSSTLLKNKGFQGSLLYIFFKNSYKNGRDKTIYINTILTVNIVNEKPLSKMVENKDTMNIEQFK